MWPIIYILSCLFLPVESVYQYKNVILEPIYRFTDTDAVPIKSIYFTKNSQYSSMEHAVKNIPYQFNAVRGPTREMFLKDLGCGTNTCQNLPFDVTPVYSVFDFKGRIKFETDLNAPEVQANLGKVGYLVNEDIEGLIRYDEYYSEEDDLFAYTNGDYPNQFYACQLREHGNMRYKFVRTLGYAFTAITVPENDPIYTIIVYDDGLPEPSTTTLSPSQHVFQTNPIWTILKNSKNGTQGVGAVNLPWTPPVSASPIEPTNVCLLNGNSSVLSRCGEIDRMLQFFDDTHVYIGFKDSIQDASNTYIYSYIGYAFTSSENTCGIPLEPIRELYKYGVGFTSVAGEKYTELISNGYSLTRKVLGYTIDCASATNGELVVTIPDGLSTATPLSSLSTASTPTKTVGFYTRPVQIVSNPSGGLQGYWIEYFDTSSFPRNPLYSTNVCLFLANSSVITRCGHARNLYQYHDTVDNFVFISLYTFGRTVESLPLGVAFETSEKTYVDSIWCQSGSCTKVYNVVAGDDYQNLLDQGYNITGNIMGYTIDCKDANDEFVYGYLPNSDEFETTTVAGRYGFKVDTVKIVFPNTGSVEYEDNGYWVNTPKRPLVTFVRDTNVCVFREDLETVEKCGATKPLYLYINKNNGGYFMGIQSFGRNLTSTELVGVAFESTENTCGLKLYPMREFYGRPGYDVHAGEDYEEITAAGYNQTGNIMGYTVDCRDAIGGTVYGHLPNTIPEEPTKPSQSTSPSTPSTPPNRIGFYVERVFLVGPKSGIAGQQGYTLKIVSNLDPDTEVRGETNVCVITGNFLEIDTCADFTQTFNSYFDANDNYYYVARDTGRPVTKAGIIGTTFSSQENLCGLNVVPIRELYKEGVGYNAVAGDDYQSLLDEGYTLNGRIMGYTVDCNDAENDFVYGFLPTTTTITKSTVSTTTAPLNRFRLSPVYIIYPTEYYLQNQQEGSHVATRLGFIQHDGAGVTNACVFLSDPSIVALCGTTAPLYLYFDRVRVAYFVGTHSAGRNVSIERAATVFESAGNTCGFTLLPLREFYKDGTGYNLHAGDDYELLVNGGFVATGNIMGYAPDCRDNGFHEPDLKDYVSPTTTTRTPEPTDTSEPGKCNKNLVTLGTTNKNRTFEMNVQYGAVTTLENKRTMTVYCQGTPTYNIYMTWDGNAVSGRNTVSGLVELNLECSLVDGKDNWVTENSNHRVTFVRCDEAYNYLQQ